MPVKQLERENVQDIDAMLIEFGVPDVEGREHEALCEEIKGSIDQYRRENGTVTKVYAGKETLQLTSNPPQGCSTCGGDSGCCTNIA